MSADGLLLKANDRALAIASPLEVPAVRIRFLTNTGAAWRISTGTPVNTRPASGPIFR